MPSISPTSNLAVPSKTLPCPLRDLNGDVYSFKKQDLISYEKEFGHSLMPGYGAVLNENEVDQVVSFLMSLRD